MNVGELRALLENVPDETPVVVDSEHVVYDVWKGLVIGLKTDDPAVVLKIEL